HSTRQQRLSDRIVDFVGACVQKIFALQVNLCATRMCSQPLRVKQWSGSSGVIAQQQVKFAPKIRVAASPRELSRQLLERADQGFRNVAPAELAPMSMRVRFA